MRLLLAFCAALVLPLIAVGDPPAPQKVKAEILPVGKWKVEFANNVVETVVVRNDATATVTEPARTADAKVTAIQGTYLVVYDDDRVERWTPVGRRMVVEHWAPGSVFPTGTAVRGIAELTD